MRNETSIASFDRNLHFDVGTLNAQTSGVYEMDVCMSVPYTDLAYKSLNIFRPHLHHAMCILYKLMYARNRSEN